MNHTAWNPWHGCHKVSEGCRNCYMYSLDRKRQVEDKSAVPHLTAAYDKPWPLQKDRHRQYKVMPGDRVMVNMTSDTFLEEADPWRDKMWDVIRQRPDVRFFLITKRPERILRCLPNDWNGGWGNVAISVSCENQHAFNIRWPELERVPAKIRGIIAAPLIGPLDVRSALIGKRLDIVECGGENYDGSRICKQEWVEKLARDTALYDIPFVFYETGTHYEKNGTVYEIPSRRVQSKQAYLLNLSHGGKPVPWDLRNTDGTPVTQEQKRQKTYNPNTCLNCGNIRVCNGCDPSCRICPKHEYVTIEELFRKETT